MVKASPNLPCPCGSRQKYKKCCQKYHKGALPATAEALMRSRYSAYALGLVTYIMKTTHPDNTDYTENTAQWKKEIMEFCETTSFLGLKILSSQTFQTEAFVTFEAMLSSGILREKSRFIRKDKRWLYIEGVYETYPST
jgi:SEC-C motif-containing protein